VNDSRPLKTATEAQRSLTSELAEALAKQAAALQGHN
jgi:hypothetical protein